MAGLNIQETNLKHKTVATRNASRSKHYTRNEWMIISLTLLIVTLGFLTRTWRLIREGEPITFDGYYYLRYIKRDFFQGWVDLTKITRDPPGFTFMIIIATHLLGLEMEPMTWAIYIFPQIVSTIQLVVFFILARRLTKSRAIGLLSVLYMAVMGLYVYRNQNVAPETMCLGLVPFVVFYILRYLETKDVRFLILGWMISFAIIMIHHLTALIVLVVWHVIIPYDFIYRKMKKETIKKSITINISFLALIDILIIVVWVFLLKSFPLKFIKETLFNSFPAGESYLPIILMIVMAMIILSLVFSIFFYNFRNKKVNKTIIISATIAVLVVFVIAMFFGAGSPDQTIISGLAMGTHAFVLGPLSAIGVTKIKKINSSQGRVIRGWLFSAIAIIAVTAVFPLLTSLLSRLVLFVIPIGAILSAIAIFSIAKKIDHKKIKALTLITLTGCMALTMAYSHPKPQNNWNIQEVYWDAEYATIDFLVLYAKVPENTVWVNNTIPQVDCDFRMAALVEGISGMESTFEEKGELSWLREVLKQNSSDLFDFVANSSVLNINKYIGYIIINDVIIETGFHIGWASYGDDNRNLIELFPDIRSMLSYNPHISRIMDNKLSILLMPRL